MSWRFKASKYKNAAPKIPKPDEWLRELNIGSYQVNGQIIKASASFIAFNADVAGSNLYVIPLNETGRKPKNYPLLHAHSDLVTDLDFSPFDDGLLATGSQDTLIKLWSIPENGLSENVNTPECTLSRPHQRRIENIVFHPVADFLLSTSSGNAVTLWDVHKQQELSTLTSEEDVIQSLSWKSDGTCIVTTCRDKKIRISDPRANAVTQIADNHSSNRESMAIWLDSTRILTSGFDSSRQRQVFVRDVRNFGQVEFSLVFDSSTGLLLPLYDADTQMLFLAGKGDNTIGFYEVNDRDPVITEGIRHTGQQSKGACLVPKRALHVMDGEANRILQLTANAVIPVSYIVPRKSYREFHADLFPETSGYEAPIYASQWITGTNAAVEKILLDPSRWQGKNLHVNRGPLSGRTEEVKTVKIVPTPKPRTSISEDNNNPLTIGNNTSKPFVAPKPMPRFSSHEANGTTGLDNITLRPVAVKRAISLRGSVQDNESNGDADHPPNVAIKRSDSEKNVNQVTNGEEDDIFARAPTTAQRRQLFQDRINSVQEPGSTVTDSTAPVNAVAASPLPKRATRIFGRVAKFRHLKGTLTPRNTHLENFRGLDNALPTECNGFHANAERVAVPLSGPGGRIAILELKKGGRLPDGPLPAFFNTCKVLDFSWNPFDNRNLAVACDDGRIRIWNVQGDGIGGVLMESSNEPSRVLEVAHNTDRVTIVQYHPIAADVVASVSADYVIRVWNVQTAACLIQLEAHPDQVFSLAWSPCGKYIASVCKDGKVRIFEPRSTTGALRQGPGPNGVKGARVVWAHKGKFVLVSGFDKSSQRLLYVYLSTDLSTSLNTLNLDVSPTLLIPYYDEDSSTLFLTGKGDTTIHCHEVAEDAPHLFPLSHHKCTTATQGMALLPKQVCQVRDVEFARFITLTSSSIEPLSFTVPRVKNDYFQDDLFPPTRILWEPSMSAAEWFAGSNTPPKKLDLKPEDMETLSSLKAQSTTPTSATGPSMEAAVVSNNASNKSGFMSAVSARKEREKGAQLEAAISSQLEVNLTLEQDRMEGVDDSEWDT